ncbi:MAG: hypothetical protein QF754_11065, partial [Alphaproteobacteria bacterium]|nr:hypothetical protein [Alphaproteobacteria bacterium]
EQVLAAFTARLAAIPDITVERNRIEPVVAFPTLVMVDGGQTVSEENTGLKLYALKLDLEGYTQATTAAELGPALSDLYAKAVAALMTDRTLGGVAIDVREGELRDPEIDRTQGHGPHAAFSLAFEVDYATDPADPYQFGP